MELSHKRPPLKFYLIFIFCLNLLLFYSPASESGEQYVEIKNIRYWSYSDYTRVVIDLSDTVEYTHKRISNPDRLFFDLKQSKVPANLKGSIKVENGMLKSIRSGQFDLQTVRVVLDLGKMENFKISSIESPPRLIIDVQGPVVVSQKKRIVLDPGHGGKDPGAVGLNNLYEKDVVLDIALKLRDIIGKHPEYEVFLTRDKDVFISLEERTAIANGKNADLFVSIHTNASEQRSAKGIETYFLNWTDNEEAMKVAARENAITVRQMKKMQAGMKDDILSIIKNDLFREYKRDRSMALASYLQKSMIAERQRSKINAVDHGVKWSFFYVLFGAKMPSVLVEVSFISNPAEEKLLGKDSFRLDVAKSLAMGIHKYMEKAEAGDSVASLRE